MRHKLSIILAVVFLLAVVAVSGPVFAAIDAGGGGSATTEEQYYGLTPGSDQGTLSQPTWKTVFSGEECSDYNCWVGKVWNWAMVIMIPLSVLIFTAAGVIYTISEGDSKRIELAKRMITGVVSGIGLLVLSRVLLLFIFGEEGSQWFIFF